LQQVRSREGYTGDSVFESLREYVFYDARLKPFVFGFASLVLLFLHRWFHQCGQRKTTTSSRSCSRVAVANRVRNRSIDVTSYPSRSAIEPRIWPVRIITRRYDAWSPTTYPNLAPGR